MIFINKSNKLFFFIFFLFANVTSADNLSYTALKNICAINENSDFQNKEIKEDLKVKKLSCFYYIKGYLEVTNHNCKFDLFTDKLHKLNTNNIKFEQILKALNIYDQKFSTIDNGNAIDHLWSVLNKHWPCNN